jgi:putative transposase
MKVQFAVAQGGLQRDGFPGSTSGLIAGSALCGPHRFWGRRGIGMLADGGLHGEGEHRLHKGLNNRAENSHMPLRKRECIMQGFRSPGSLQRFVSVFSTLRNLFVPSRSERSALATHIHRL